MGYAAQFKHKKFEQTSNGGAYSKTARNMVAKDREDAVLSLQSSMLQEKKLRLETLKRRKQQYEREKQMQQMQEQERCRKLRERRLKIREHAQYIRRTKGIRGRFDNKKNKSTKRNVDKNMFETQSHILLRPPQIPAALKSARTQGSLQALETLSFTDQASCFEEAREMIRGLRKQLETNDLHDFQVSNKGDLILESIQDDSSFAHAPPSAGKNNHIGTHFEGSKITTNHMATNAKAEIDNCEKTPSHKSYFEYCQHSEPSANESDVVQEKRTPEILPQQQPSKSIPKSEKWEITFSPKNRVNLKSSYNKPTAVLNDAGPVNVSTQRQYLVSAQSITESNHGNTKDISEVKPIQRENKTFIQSKTEVSNENIIPPSTAAYSRETFSTTPTRKKPSGLWSFVEKEENNSPKLPISNKKSAENLKGFQRPRWGAGKETSTQQQRRVAAIRREQFGKVLRTRDDNKAKSGQNRVIKINNAKSMSHANEINLRTTQKVHGWNSVHRKNKDVFSLEEDKLLESLDRLDLKLSSIKNNQTKSMRTMASQVYNLETVTNIQTSNCENNVNSNNRQQPYHGINQRKLLNGNQVKQNDEDECYVHHEETIDEDIAIEMQHSDYAGAPNAPQEITTNSFSLEKIQDARSAPRKKDKGFPVFRNRESLPTNRTRLGGVGITNVQSNGTKFDGIIHKTDNMHLLFGNESC